MPNAFDDPSVYRAKSRAGFYVQKSIFGYSQTEIDFIIANFRPTANLFPWDHPIKGISIAEEQAYLDYLNAGGAPPGGVIYGPPAALNPPPTDIPPMWKRDP